MYWVRLSMEWGTGGATFYRRMLLSIKSPSLVFLIHRSVNLKHSGSTSTAAFAYHQQRTRKQTISSRQTISRRLPYLPPFPTSFPALPPLPPLPVLPFIIARGRTTVWTVEISQTLFQLDRTFLISERATENNITVNSKNRQICNKIIVNICKFLHIPWNLRHDIKRWK